MNSHWAKNGRSAGISVRKTILLAALAMIVGALVAHLRGELVARGDEGLELFFL